MKSHLLLGLIPFVFGCDELGPSEPGSHVRADHHQLRAAKLSAMEAHAIASELANSEFNRPLLWSIRQPQK